MGKRGAGWQDTDAVLRLFGSSVAPSRKQYRCFVEEGLLHGRRDDLIGGGLVRSAGGWGVVKMMRKLNVHLKGDERILGDSDFVEAILRRAGEDLDLKYRFRARGFDWQCVVEKAATEFGIDAGDVRVPGKQPKRVKARSVAAYWAVHYLDMRGTEVGKRLGIGQPAVSRAVQRGRQLVKELGLTLKVDKNT
jgi:hypothetical protein